MANQFRKDSLKYCRHLELRINRLAKKCDTVYHRSYALVKRRKDLARKVWLRRNRALAKLTSIQKSLAHAGKAAAIKKQMNDRGLIAVYLTKSQRIKLMYFLRQDGRKNPRR